MAAVKELLRAENDGSLSFGDYTLSEKTKKDNYKRNRDLLYIVSGAIYAIQIIDATVFAHFYDFEINDDLSMNLRPSTGFSPVSGGTVGLTLTFNF